MYQYSHSMFMGLTLCKEYQKLISKKRNNVAREIPETGVLLVFQNKNQCQKSKQQYLHLKV